MPEEFEIVLNILELRPDFLLVELWLDIGQHNLIKIVSINQSELEILFIIYKFIIPILNSALPIQCQNSLSNIRIPFSISEFPVPYHN